MNLALLPPSPLLPSDTSTSDAGFEVCVATARDATPEIRVFELQRIDRSPLPSFTAGAHIDVHLPTGQVRQYSLCNSPTLRDRYVIAVKRESAGRGGSMTLHQEVTVGDRLRMTGPRNHFPIDESADEHLLLAGGIGVTPLLAMARTLKATGRRFRLIYFTRSAEHTAFLEELSTPEWARFVDFRFGVEPSELPATLRTLLADAPPGRHVYVCGPRPFMETALGLAREQHRPDAVHSEFFSGDAALQSAPSKGFTIRCARTEKEIVVAEGERVVDVLVRNGVRVDVMCEQGVCGTCITTVLQGRPEHRDSYLTEEERAANDCMMVCCSRSLDPVLVLDI